MTRMTIDCRTLPSESNCGLTLTGERDEVLRAATAHAVEVHGHTDGPELREALEGSLAPAPLDLDTGAFVQVIEFRTDDIDAFDGMEEEWLADIGDARTATWSVITGDRDDPGMFLQLVAFPDYDSAMRNSKHPATQRIAERLGAMTEGEAGFRNLDVRQIRTY